MLGLPDGDTDPFMDTLAQDETSRDQHGNGSCSDSGRECEFAQEPPELLAARQQLAAYTARPDEEELAGGCRVIMSLAGQHSPSAGSAAYSNSTYTRSCSPAVAEPGQHGVCMFT
jgi:hypothetical protein